MGTDMTDVGTSLPIHFIFFVVNKHTSFISVINAIIFHLATAKMLCKFNVVKAFILTIRTHINAKVFAVQPLLT